MIAAADHLIDLGPGAGRLGGEIVAAGTVAEVTRQSDSKTGMALRGEIEFRSKPIRDLSKNERLVVRGATANNLGDLTVEIPLGGFAEEGCVVAFLLRGVALFLQYPSVRCITSSNNHGIVPSGR